MTKLTDLARLCRLANDALALSPDNDEIVAELYWLVRTRRGWDLPAMITGTGANAT